MTNQNIAGSYYLAMYNKNLDEMAFYLKEDVKLLPN